MKKLLNVLVALMVVTLLPLTSVNARVESSQGEANTDYYAVETNGPKVLDLQFTGSGTWGDKAGLYAPAAYEEDGKLVYSGAASWTKYMTINPNEEYKNAVLKVDVVAELIGVREFYACARQDYDLGNAYPSIIRESGVQNIQYDADGKVVSYDKRVGWLGGSDDTTKDVFSVTEDGYLHMQFVVVTNDKGIAEIGFEIVGYDTSNATVKIDSLEISKAALNAVYDHSFDGSGDWGDKDGLYAPRSNYEQDGKLVYTGAASWTQFLVIKPNEAFKNSIVVVDAVVELVGVTDFYATARQDYSDRAYPSILREAGIKWISYDEAGKVTGFSRRDGWLGLSDDYNRDSFTITPEGYVKMRAVVFTGPEGLAEINFELVGADQSNATVKFDSLTVSTCEFPTSSTTYYTYAWNTSMEDLDTNGAAWDNQPIWADSMDWETENPLDGTHSIKVNGSATSDPAWGIQVGGFDNTSPEKRLLKSTGLHYIQMDVDSADFEWFNIWTLGDDYYAIKFNLATGWSTEGKVQNFKAVDLGHCYRISYYVNYTDMNTPHNINVFNGSGSIYFDNLIVAYVDDAPFVQSGLTYDAIDTTDVVANIGLKAGTNPVLLDAAGNAVDANLYAIADGTLTLDKALFTGEDSYSFTLQTSMGSKAFTVNKKDNRTVISAINLTGVSKVYDGTTAVDMSKVSYTLAGVAEGDDVTVTFDLEYSSANAGANVALVVSNLEISGEDAYKYLLAEEYALTGTIEAKVVTVVADSHTKVEGEDDPAFTYTISGLLGDDKVTGSLARTAGEKAGKYDIKLGTLAVPANYVIEFTKGQLEITAKPVDNPTDNPSQGEDNPTDNPTDNPSQGEQQPEEQPGEQQPSEEQEGTVLDDLLGKLPFEIPGCTGSVMASIFGLLTLAGAVLVVRRKREE